MRMSVKLFKTRLQKGFWDTCDPACSDHEITRGLERRLKLLICQCSLVVSSQRSGCKQSLVDCVIACQCKAAD